MKNSTVMVALCAITFLLSSCVLKDDPFGFREGMGGKRSSAEKDSCEVDKPSPAIQSVYVSAIDEISSSIVLYKNGKKVLSIPYGDNECISSEPDMHYLIDGSIFTQYIGDDCTVIKRDGIELFVIEGRETLKGLLVDGKDVYSLSQKCSEEGFTYRKNGVTIFQGQSGKICGNMYEPSYMRTGALYKDQGAICFAYSTSGLSDWHLVKNGIDNKLEIPPSIWAIYDLRLVNGTLCFVCKDDVTACPVLYVGSERFDFSASPSIPENNFKIYTGGNELFFSGSLKNSGAGFTSCWTMGGKRFTFPGPGCTVYSDGESIAYTQQSAQSVQLVKSGSSPILMDGRYEYLSCWNVDFSDGVFRVVLTPKDSNKKPFLWENGTRTEFDIVGRLTSVYYGD